MDNAGTLFVWRQRLMLEKSNIWHQMIQPINKKDTCCPYCSSIVDVSAREQGWEDWWEHRCSFCGFFIRSEEVFGGGWHDRLTVSYLKELCLNSEEVSLAELNTHLLRKFSDVTKIDPRRFELAVGDVYRNYGYHVEYTAQTRDGGYDLVLLRGGSGDTAIVECKRYKNKIDVGIVRQLIGVQLIRGYNKAILLTSSYFTNDARKEAEMLLLRDSGFEMELVDADEFLKMLEVYNEKLPPLDLASRIEQEENGYK